MINTSLSEADYQLLLVAGQKAGIPTRVIAATGGMYWIEETKSIHSAWNPLNSDADALRLAVQMGMINPGCFPAVAPHLDLNNPDWEAATRRAIVMEAVTRYHLPRNEAAEVS